MECRTLRLAPPSAPFLLCRAVRADAVSSADAIEPLAAPKAGPADTSLPYAAHVGPGNGTGSRRSGHEREYNVTTSEGKMMPTYLPFRNVGTDAASAASSSCRAWPSSSMTLMLVRQGASIRPSCPPSPFLPLGAVRADAVRWSPAQEIPLAPHAGPQLLVALAVEDGPLCAATDLHGHGNKRNALTPRSSAGSWLRAAVW